MSIIKQDDFIQSIADAFQFISYYHSADFIQALTKAWQAETGAAAKNAIEQIITNSHLCAIGKRPLCQDTGTAIVFLKIGMNVQWQAQLSVTEMVNEGVRLAYCNPDNILRASMVSDPAGARQNTKNNLPAMIHMEVVAGDKVEVMCTAKGGGSENKSKLGMLNPSDSVADWVISQLPKMGAGWCPPGVLGIGIGGSPEKAMLMAKESLMAPVDIHHLYAKAQSAQPLSTTEKLRLELYERINQLGIGAQGLGGDTTVFDVKILDFPTHAASLPVALVPSCAATRHIEFKLDGSGPAKLNPPDLSLWPQIAGAKTVGKKINVDNLTKQDLADLKQGDTVLLTGHILTGRDAAHKRIVERLNNDLLLPVSLKNRIIYYVGPVDPVGDEVVGPAGPTTSTRMDKFTPQLLEQAGLIGMIGKAERGAECVQAIKKNAAVYFVAVGGAAYLVSKAIKSAKVIAFPELGMEAIYEFYVENMPVTVAVDSRGNSVYDNTVNHYIPVTIQDAGKKEHR